MDIAVIAFKQDRLNKAAFRGEPALKANAGGGA